MAVLSDGALARRYPSYGGDVGPASLDLHIANTLFGWPKHIRRDPRKDQGHYWQSVSLQSDDDGLFWLLLPGVRYLAATRERIKIPIDHAGQIGARSSWGRDGLAVIQGPAGWCDPGYVGNPTLELSVVGSELVLWPGACVAQLILFELTEAAVRPYGHPSRQSKYQNHSQPEPSRMHLEAVR